MEEDDVVDLLVERFDLSHDRAVGVASTIIGLLGPAIAIMPVAAVVTFIAGFLSGTHGGGSSDED